MKQLSEFQHNLNSLANTLFIGPYNQDSSNYHTIAHPHLFKEICENSWIIEKYGANALI
ncbi:hypothetical protein METHB2_390026 [Candidatus Methylobacter favarea]|uniref:Uncharacterized protein n=1 Tax=Candidatus Methylobacter favarea TaxID=2707345 RepID=A0A8S0XT42_9GAMM|nr:hypothetical protein METHB2_390026 [Candidatus Methylobacter favarea]